MWHQVQIESWKDYHAIPISQESHAKHASEHQVTVCLHLTNEKNKCPILHQLTPDNVDTRIIVLMETWLKKAKHPNSEIRKHFKQHHVIRLDRKLKAEDPVPEAHNAHFGKSGGCLLLSNNQIPIEIDEQKSNGNVEFIIAEATSLNTAFILEYNPPSNFSLRKFKEAIGLINIYFNQNK